MIIAMLYNGAITIRGQGGVVGMRGRDNRTVTAVLGPGRKGGLAYGYEKASLRKMAREAAVTIGAMYGYFPGKELLFKALAPDAAEELLALYDKARGMRTVGGADRGVC